MSLEAMEAIAWAIWVVALGVTLGWVCAKGDKYDRGE